MEDESERLLWIPVRELPKCRNHTQAPGIVVATLAHLLSLPPSMNNSSSSVLHSASAYILENRVHHTRSLPPESAHSFTYPTLSLLLSLSHLEAGILDLGGGILFEYNKRGKTRWRLRVLTIRPQPYLQDSPGSSTKGKESPSIRSKLEMVLRRFDYDATLLDGVWMLTMPCYLGVEGINPLTVHFCYKHGETRLWLVVLEVHNTFSEQYVYVLPVGLAHEEEPILGYEHTWTFPRQFHVSPFNDRLGFYQCSIVAPPCPPPPLTFKGGCVHTRRPLLSLPKVLLKLLAPDDGDGVRRVKLTASLRAVSSAPLRPQNLIFALLKQPVSLLLTFPRIVYEAYQLHYKRGLDVFARPEPRAVDPKVAKQMQPRVNPVQTDEGELGVGGGIGWQSEGFLDRVAKKIVEGFLHRRALETGIRVAIDSTNPTYGRKVFQPLFPYEGNGPAYHSPLEQKHCELVIQSSKVFTLLLVSPSARHALLLVQDTEKMLDVSNPELFIQIFDPSANPRSATLLQSINQLMRSLPLPSILNYDPELSDAIPSVHVLDMPIRSGFFGLTLLTHTYRNFLLVHLFLLTMLLEKFVFTTILKARFVPGTEPWLLWERAAKVWKAS